MGELSLWTSWCSHHPFMGMTEWHQSHQKRNGWRWNGLNCFICGHCHFMGYHRVIPVSMLSEGWWELHCKEPMREKAGQPWCGPFVTQARQCPDALGWGPLFTAVTAFGTIAHWQSHHQTVTCFGGNPARLKGIISPALPVQPSYASMDAHCALTPSWVNAGKVIKLSLIQQRVLKIMSSIWDIVFQLIYRNIPWGEEGGSISLSGTLFGKYHLCIQSQVGNHELVKGIRLVFT